MVTLILKYMPYVIAATAVAIVVAFVIEEIVPRIKK